MNRRDRKAAVSKAKANGMNRRDRKALGRKLKTDNLKTQATEELAYLRQRKRDILDGDKNFSASELAAFRDRLDDDMVGRKFNPSGLTARLRKRL